MKQVILEKISNELNSRISTEAQVLYLLAEVRKILAMDGNTEKTLRIFCDWVLHSELSYPRTKKYFLSKFEPYINNKTNSKVVGRMMISGQDDFFKLLELKTELGRFFKQNHLQGKLIDDDVRWSKFVVLLLKILEECPVKINGTKIDRLSLVEDRVGNSIYRFKLKNRLLDKKNIIKIKLKIVKTLIYKRI